MGPRLTDTRVQSIKPERGKRKEVFDPQEPGLLIRVSEHGRRTWFFRYRLADGRQPRFKLGTYPATSIADARDRAQAARKLVEAGKDPAAVERQAEAEARARVVRTFGDLMDAYFEACEGKEGRPPIWQPKGKPKRERTLSDERAVYARHIKKPLAKLQLAEVGRVQIKGLTRSLLAKGVRTQTNHVHALIRQAFNYAVAEELLEGNPALGMPAPAPKKARARLLSDVELSALWAALKDPAAVKDKDGESLLKISKGTALALQLTALLLQRRAEIATMRIDDLDIEGAVWVIPAERAKNGRPHAVPLPPAAVQLIKDALAIKTRRKSIYVFPSTRRGGKEPIHPDALTRAMGTAMKALGFPLAGPHDLRRTGATLMASERAGITPFLVSRILGHRSDTGGAAAVTMAHYALHEFMPEKRRSLGAWEDLLLEIVGERERPSNVNRLERRA